MLDNIVAGGNALRVFRGKGYAEKRGAGSYKGCWYTSTFRVNKPIYITELFFMGLAKKGEKEDDAEKFNREKHDITVKIYVCRTVQHSSNSCGIGNLMACFGIGSCLPFYQVVDIMPPSKFHVGQLAIEEKFSVKLNEPVLIHPFNWVDLKFEICGPKTENAKDGFLGGRQVVKRFVFDFATGSKQMPGFAFLPAEENNLEKVIYKK